MRQPGEKPERGWRNFMGVRRGWRARLAPSFGALGSMVTMSALAVADSTLTTTTRTTTTVWYGQWWLWAVGVGVFLIVIIALTNRGGRSA